MIVEGRLIRPQPFPIRGFLEALRGRVEGCKGIRCGAVADDAVRQGDDTVRGLDEVDGNLLEGAEPCSEELRTVKSGG